MARSFRRATPRRTIDNRVGRGLTTPVPSPIEIGTVGYTDDQTDMPETSSAYVRWEEGEPLVEVTLRDGDRIVARVGVWPTTVRFGQQVVIAMHDGDPANAVIIGVLHDTNFPVPSSVGGVDTGASTATTKGVRPPAATWTFLRLEDGEHFAVQTQAGGDVLIHAGASIWLRCHPSTGAVHVEGAVHLGVGPLSPPIGSTVGPADQDIPGVPAVPYVPVPYAPPGPQAPSVAGVPYVGFEDGLVRAKDLYQSNLTIDPDFWAWVISVSAAAGLPDPPPTNLYVAISGAAGPGSKHTAVGEPEPV